MKQQRQTDDTRLDLHSLQDSEESASQSCYALLKRHTLYGLMNDRCFIHGGEIVYTLWSTFQVLWRLQRMGAEGLKRREDWLNSLVSAIPSDEKVILTVCWCLSLCLSKLISSKLFPDYEMPASRCWPVHALRKKKCGFKTFVSCLLTSEQKMQHFKMIDHSSALFYMIYVFKENTQTTIIPLSSSEH